MFTLSPTGCRLVQTCWTSTIYPINGYQGKCQRTVKVAGVTPTILLIEYRLVKIHRECGKCQLTFTWAFQWHHLLTSRDKLNFHLIKVSLTLNNNRRMYWQNSQCHLRYSCQIPRDVLNSMDDDIILLGQNVIINRLSEYSKSV